MRIRAILMGVAACGSLWAANTCAPPLDAFENQFRVASVTLDTPLNFGGRLAAKLIPAAYLAKLDFTRARLPIQVGQPFQCSVYEAAMDMLAAQYGSGSLHPGEYFRMAVVIPEVKPANGSVDVIYHIYTSEPAYYLTRIFEARNDSITRNLAPVGTFPSEGTPRPLPYLSFNSSRSLVFGSSASIELRSGLLNSIEADASGSKNSATASLFLSGSRQFPRGWLQYLRWSLGYRYENLPGDKLALQSGRGVLSLLGASRASGSLGVITRFGLSLEGGNAQSNLLVPSSPYGALKSYAGLTFNLGRQAFAGSYGIQFGSGSSRPAWDYTKHLANVSYSTRILKEEHKPLTLDLQAGAGYIPGSAALVPIADRFFGGNVERNFIEGDSWHLPRSPMIRSFAESEFGRAGIGGGIGGRDFYSFNATIAQTVMARAVVPQSLTDDPSFRRKLGGQVANARSADKLTYLAESPMFTKILQELSKAEPLLTRAAQLSADLRTAMAANSAMISNLNGLDAAITGANSAIASARKTRMTGLAQVRTLAVGFLQPGETDNCAALVPSLVTQFVCAAQTLVAAAPGNATIAELAAIAKQLTPLRDDWAKAYLALRQQAYLTPADSAKVQAKLNQIAALLGQVFAVAQSPVLLADLKEVCGSFQTSNCEALRNVDPEAVSNTGDWLAIGTGELTPPFLTTIAADAEPLLKPRAEQIRQLAAELKSTMDSLHRPPVELRAIRDTKFTGRLLDVIFRELNLYSIAPFAMFDAARIGGTGSPAFDKLRYAAGPGVRFSVVNFNVNVGYALNINKQPGERFGSIYFSLNVSDLFR